MIRPVVFVSAEPRSAEEQAALSWLEGRAFGHVRVVSPTKLHRELTEASVVWWHAANTGLNLPELATSDVDSLLDWLRAGGGLLLTLHAAALLPRFGLEDRQPDELGWHVWRHSDSELEALEGERRGVVGFGPHPVFDGLAGGAMLVQPSAGAAYPEAVYARPVHGRVIAAEWQYLAIEANRRLVLEHQVGDSRVLSVGAHLRFGDTANPFRPSLERFAANCLRYLGEPASGNRTYWPAIVFPPASKELGSITPLASPGSIRNSKFAIRATTIDGQPALVSDGAGDWPFDLAARQIVLMGRERTGVQEIWSLPVRLARNVTIRFDGVSESDALREVWRQPDVLHRVFDTGSARVALSISAAGGEVSLSFAIMHGSVGTMDLAFECDLRCLWPYPEGVLGQPHTERVGDELRLLDGEGVVRGAVSFEPWPDQLEIEQGSGQSRVGARFERPRRVVLNVHPPQEMLRSTLSMTTGMGRPDESLLSIETPDDEFNIDLFWAINGLRSFDVESCAGRGLVAGYAETGTGWWGGRLGYAWYFGRDTLWSLPACLAIGMHDAARESLRLQTRWQSPEGKIFHELTPAGIGHYDAADSTPLFLVGLERYLRWTGDDDLLRELWPAAEKALAFCFSTDRDGDGLIENTGVGHGWSEGGPVYGAHATFYLNACWAAALAATCVMAGWMNKRALAKRCAREFGRVRLLLNERFHRHGWFAYGLAGDGSCMHVKTIEPAVAGLFGLLDPAKGERFFDAVASPRFTTPWGVRYIANDDPAYHPRGYHHGSVWPLFTGWTATAEYAYGRPMAAFEHVRSSLRLVRLRSLGAIDEVLDGDTGEPAGVCAHQLWSHAMTVMPIIEGLLGVQPDAIANQLVLRPQLPPEWDFVRVRNLRIGPYVLSFSCERSASGLELKMDRPTGLKVEFYG